MTETETEPPEPPLSTSLGSWLASLPLWFYYLLLVILVLVLFGPRLGHGLMLYDMGELSFFVSALIADKVPGIDFVVGGYGPARYLLLSWLVPLFDGQLLVQESFFLLVRLAAALALMALSRRLLPAPWSVLPVLCFLIAPGPLHKGLFVLGSVVLALAVLRFVERPEGDRAGQLGWVVALVGAGRLDLGALGLLLVLGLSANRRRRSKLLLLLLPSLLLVGLFMSWLAGQEPAAVGAVFEQALDDALINQSVDHPRFPSFLELWTAGRLEAWLLWSPIFIYGGLLLRLLLYAPVLPGPAANDRFAARHGRWLVLSLGLLTCNQVRMKPELGHLLQAGPLLYLAATCLLADLGRALPGYSPGLSLASQARRDRRGVLAFCATLILPLALLFAVLGPHRGDLYTGSFTIPWERNVALDSPLGRVFVSAEEYAELAPLLTWLEEEAPEGPLWVPTHQPLLYGLSGRDEVTGFSSLAFFAHSSARQQLLLERLKKRPPAVVVFEDNSIEGPRLFIKNAAPEVLAWLHEHYREELRFGPRRVLLPASAAR